MKRSGSTPGLDGERPTRKGSRTRERIVAAAVELFAEQGYHPTTLSEIGDRADIQRGALYYHIKAKEELLFEILRVHVEFILENVQKIAAEPNSPAEKFRRLITFQTQALLERRAELTIYARDSHSLTGERLTEFRRLQGAVEQVWAQVLSEGQRTGALRKLDPALIKVVIGLVNSPYTWFRPGGRLTSGDVAELVAELTMNGVTDDDGRARR